MTKKKNGYRLNLLYINQTCTYIRYRILKKFRILNLEKCN